MAENLESENSGEVQGEHNPRFVFSVCPYPNIYALEYPHIHHTRCKSLPTSWSIDVKFEEASSNSCLVSLIRTDFINNPVDAFVWVSCFNIYNRRLSSQRLFFKGGVLPYVRQEEYIRKLVPDEELRILEDQTLVVEVSALITSCHQKVGPSAANKSFHWSQMKCSKL